MDQFAKSAIVASISDGSLEWPLDPPARGTLSKTFRIAFRVRGKNPLATDGANIAGYRLDTAQAAGADREAGNIQ
ncbi:MAG TPA: hypothetical protein VF730_14050 [Terracidiphilus sp.]